jgi:hypothetical protein
MLILLFPYNKNNKRFVGMFIISKPLSDAQGFFYWNILFVPLLDYQEQGKSN